MTLNQLRYFQAVCKYHSISKASAMLHVTQPAVSIAISNLEEEFGVTLFNRDNRLLEITDAGQVFLNLVNELLANVDAMYEKMQDLKSNNSLLRLSIVPWLQYSFAEIKNQPDRYGVDGRSGREAKLY